jgi:hypothetical protein
MALGLEFGNLLERADLPLLLGVDAIAGVLEHGHGVEGDVGPGPGVLGRAEVVGVGLTGDCGVGARKKIIHIYACIC